MSTETVFERGPGPYDIFMSPLEFLWLKRWRRRWLPLVSGDVLEVGFGSGASLPFYAAHCCHLLGVDSNLEMLKQASRHTRQPRLRVSLQQMDVQHLGFARASFDWVVSSLLFCSVTNQLRGLSEIHRVLRPGGRLLMIEHVRSTVPLMGLALDFANIFWHGFTHSCHLNRHTTQTVKQAGFELEQVERHLLGAVNIILAHASKT